MKVIEDRPLLISLEFMNSLQTWVKERQGFAQKHSLTEDKFPAAQRVNTAI